MERLREGEVGRSGPSYSCCKDDDVVHFPREGMQTPPDQEIRRGISRKGGAKKKDKHGAKMVSWGEAEQQKKGVTQN